MSRILKQLKEQTKLLEKQNELLQQMNALLSAADFGDSVYEGIQNILTYGGMKGDA